jgi:hypothetical protein
MFVTGSRSKDPEIRAFLHNYAVKRSSRMKKLLLLYLVSVFIIGCKYVPYNRDLELAGSTLPKLQPEASIGPLTIPYCASNGSIYFLPDRDNYSTGYLVHSSDSGTIDLMYVYLDATMKPWLTNTISLTVNGYSPYKPNFLLEPLPGGTDPYYGFLFYIRYDMNTNPPYNQLPMMSIIRFDKSSNSIGHPPDIGLLSGNQVALNGAFFVQSSSAMTFHSMHLNVNGSVYTHEETASPVNTGGIGVASSVRTIPCPAVTRLTNDYFYNYDPASNRTVISFIDNGGVHNLFWDKVPLTESKFWGAFPLLKILSNSVLLTYSNGVMYGMNMYGLGLYRIPLGSLRFLYEKFDTARNEYRMVFSLTTVDMPNGDNCNARYYFSVYSFPTSSIEALDF